MENWAKIIIGDSRVMNECHYQIRMFKTQQGINIMERYTCEHCQGSVQIKIIEETKKAIEPIIEFCPFCGMFYQVIIFDS